MKKINLQDYYPFYTKYTDDRKLHKDFDLSKDDCN